MGGAAALIAAFGMPILLPELLAAYSEHRHDLAAVRQQMRRLLALRCIAWRDRSPLHRGAARLLRPLPGPWHGEARMLAQLDDEVCELTYLLLRRRRPRTVVEISPLHGWSTAWILSALRDNGSGALTSFDLLDVSRRNVPAGLQQGRWQLQVGDVRQRAAELPAPIDFLFMDSDHSAGFAHWYVTEVFPRLRPGAVVCVDDVFHARDPGAFDGEGRYVVDWLERRSIPYFTCARARDASALNAITGRKVELGLGRRLRPGQGNTTIFFELPAAY